MKTWVLPVVLLAAAGLRLWGLLFGFPAEHPDEQFLVVYPLNFLSGDLNPHSFHKPTFHFYLLGILYATYFAAGSLLGRDWTLAEFAAYHTFFDTDTLLLLARLASVLFSLSTIWWVYLLTQRLGGRAIAASAAGLLAVSVLHVRQTPLAAVDVPLTMWVVGATWAAVRLLAADRPRDYLLAGGLVGLAASTKYPGAAAAVAILAAHLIARRSVLDRRLWLACLGAVVLFLLTSPYVLLDFATFKAHFLYQTSHAQAGRGSGGPAWWYHLRFSLPHSLGYLGLAAAAVAVGQQLFRRRQPEVWVVLAAVAGLGLAVGWGQLAFVRYILPLVALQAVLVATLLVPLRPLPWRIGLLAILVIEPLYGSLRIAQLQASEDTRHAARGWIERHVPPGSRCCNFGGWAGNVPVQTIEHLWWKRQKALRNVNERSMDRLLPFLDRANPGRPFYSYAIQYGNRALQSGRLQTIMDFGCQYVILHDHPLSRSAAAGALSVELTHVGERVAVFEPEGLTSSRPQYDPIDAYYIPLSRIGALKQSGPVVEIWRVPVSKPVITATQSARGALAAADRRAAKSALDAGMPAEFVRRARRALRRDPSVADARFHNDAGIAHRKLGNYIEAIRQWEQALALDPELVDAQFNLGLVYRFDLDQSERAVSHWQAALAIEPDHVPSHDHLGAALRAQGHPDAAVDHWRRIIELEPRNADAHYNLGLVYAYDLDRPEEAIGCWRASVRIRPEHHGAQYNLGLLLYGQGRYAEALSHWKAAVALDPTDARSYNSLGSAYRALADYEAAIGAWKRSIELDPNYTKAHFNMGLTYLNDLGQMGEAHRYLQRVLELQPRHPRADEIRRVLAAKL